MATKNAPIVMIEVDGVEVRLTNALMMEYAVDALRKVDAPEAVIEKAIMHLAQLRKGKSGEKKETEKHKENVALAKRILAAMPDDEPVTGAWIVENVEGVGSSQRCTAIMKILVENELVVKIPKVEGSRLGYQKK